MTIAQNADKQTTPPARNKKPLSTELKENLLGYLFILPAFAIITLFGLFPIGYAVYMSLFRWRVRQGRFIWFENYTDAIGDWWGLVVFLVGFAIIGGAVFFWNKAFKKHARRGLIRGIATPLLVIAGLIVIGIGWEMMMEASREPFLQSLIITLYYAAGTVPLQIIIGMVLAYVLFQKIKGKEFFRMIFFLPYVMPVIATAAVFRTLFSPRETSLANQAITLLGIAPQQWLFEPTPITKLLFGWDLPGIWAGPSLALISTIIFGIWTYVGYDAVIFLAGLGSIPGDLYEAAEIDGADKFQQFRYITLPMLSPVTFYLSMIAIIGTFKSFNHIYVMRQPSAQGTLDTTSLVIFDTFYSASSFGYAAAQAILLFLVILALTQIQNKFFGDKVFYG